MRDEPYQQPQQAEQFQQEPFNYTQPQQPVSIPTEVHQNFIPPQRELVDSCTDMINDIIDTVPNLVKDETGKVRKVWSPTNEKRKRLGYNLAVIVGKGGKYVNPETLAIISLFGFFGMSTLSTLPEIIDSVKQLGKPATDKGVN
jgi:hypothetical protein